VPAAGADTDGADLTTIRVRPDLVGHVALSEVIEPPTFDGTIFEDHGAVENTHRNLGDVATKARFEVVVGRPPETKIFPLFTR
jgi:hypothetical protein